MSDQKTPKFSRNQFPTVNLDFGGARKKTWDELADEIERLTAEGEVLLTAIAEIAGQKLCKEMELPDDGDYRYAYEEMIRVARLASDSVSDSPAPDVQDKINE